MNTWRNPSAPRALISARAALVVALLSSGCQSVPLFDNVAIPHLAPPRQAPVATVPEIEPELIPEAVEEELVIPDTLRGEPAVSAAPLSWRPLLLQILEKRARRIPAGERAEMVDALLAANEDHLLDPFLILGVIEQESRFKPDAIGPHGSIGLMQVRPFVGKDVARRIGMEWRGYETLLDPSSNLRLGIAYLNQMLEMYGDEDLALAAYNMGPYRLRRMLRRGGFPRGTYSGKVFRHRDDFETRSAELVAAAAR